MADAVKTLLLPFESGALPQPCGDWAFLNAVATPHLRDVFASARLTCDQAFRPDFLDLQASGFDAGPALSDAPAGRFDGALVLLGKHRRLNEAEIARAARLVKPGAPVIVAGAKTLGGASTRKWAAGLVELSGTLAKTHAVVFWFAADAAPFADVSLKALEPAPGYATAPGMFSADRVDTGSALLASHIGRDVSGAVADFGAGWGWLSGQVLERGAPWSIDLIEADHRSLEAALANLTAKAGNVTVSGHWLDATREPAPGRYDTIVMNPPFHAGRASEPDLGRRFIAAAAGALKPEGRLLMVANRRLPYERTLAQLFAEVSLVAEDTAFKVIAARLPGDQNRPGKNRARPRLNAA